MKYLLDTNICIYMLNGNSDLNQRVSTMGISSFTISNAILAELYYGAYNSKKVKENLRRIETFKKHLSLLSDSEKSAAIFGKIKSVLKSKGKLIDDFDILIASIVLANGLILVTNNVNHFSRIDGLQVENWL